MNLNHSVQRRLIMEMKISRLTLIKRKGVHCIPSLSKDIVLNDDSKRNIAEAIVKMKGEKKNG